MFDFASTTLSNICQTIYEYAEYGSSTLVATSTEICYNPVNSFLIIGGIIFIFLAIVIGMIKIIK